MIDSHDDWDRLFDQLPIDTSASDEQLTSVKQRVLDAFEDRPSTRSQFFTIQKIGHTLMRYKVPHTMAAMFLVAVTFWFFTSVSSTALALDVLVERLMNVRTARYDMVVTVEDQQPMKIKGFYLEPSHFREEIDGSINITDWTARKRIGLDSKTKQATVFNLQNLSDDPNIRLQEGNWFEGIRQMLRAATTVPKTNIASLGSKQLDGRSVEGFYLESTITPLTLWADSKTKLPVRIEFTMIGPPKTEAVMTNFEFNIELDESLFSIEIPEGYTVADVNFDLSLPNESDLLTALRLCCEVSDGAFPTGFDSASIGKYTATYLHKTGIDLNKGVDGEVLKESMKIGRGFQFVLMLSEEPDAHYAGAGAKYGDAERAVLWYKPQETEKYRVIYADLSVRESIEAPKLADAIRLAK